MCNSVELVAIPGSEHQVTRGNRGPKRVPMDGADVLRDLQERHIPLRIAEAQLAANAGPRMLVRQQTSVALVVNDFDLRASRC